MSETAASTGTTPTVTESTQEDLAIQRYLLDLALQPLDAFDGFTILEQYGGSALRYQLNYLSYALSMAQYTRTPAFTGYLAEAQRNAIDKMCDRRVWSYWAKENLVGYQRWNPDPIVHANVMYTGFFGAMIGMYETLNDDHRYDSPGSLPLNYDDKHRYQYDFRSLSEAIVRNMRKSKHIQYPCEPHLIYPMCNTFAMSTLVMHDRLHGTELTDDIVERVQDGYTKFGYLRKDGRFLAGKGPLGVKFPPMVANDSIMSYWLHPLMPDQAKASWQLVRDRFIKLGELEVELSNTHLERIDVGSYMRGDAMTRAVTKCAAKEFGDAEAAAGLERSIDNRHEITRRNGARKYKGASVWANAAFALATFTRENGVRDLIGGHVPEAWRTGPVLAQAAYPEVLVARAVTDGSALDLVLRPGNGDVRTTLKLGRLNPGQAYRITGATSAEVTADAEGTALLDVDLNDRTEVRLAPAA